MVLETDASILFWNSSLEAALIGPFWVAPWILFSPALGEPVVLVKMLYAESQVPFLVSTKTSELSFLAPSEKLIILKLILVYSKEIYIIVNSVALVLVKT